MPTHRHPPLTVLLSRTFQVLVVLTRCMCPDGIIPNCEPRFTMD